MKNKKVQFVMTQKLLFLQYGLAVRVWVGLRLPRGPEKGLEQVELEPCSAAGQTSLSLSPDLFPLGLLGRQASSSGLPWPGRQPGGWCVPDGSNRVPGFYRRRRCCRVCWGTWPWTASGARSSYR